MNPITSPLQPRSNTRLIIITGILSIATGCIYIIAALKGMHLSYFENSLNPHLWGIIRYSSILYLPGGIFLFLPRFRQLALYLSGMVTTLFLVTGIALCLFSESVWTGILLTVIALLFVILHSIIGWKEGAILQNKKAELKRLQTERDELAATLNECHTREKYLVKEINEREAKELKRKKENDDEFV